MDRNTLLPTLLVAAAIGSSARADFQNPFVPAFRGQPGTETAAWESFLEPSLLPNAPDVPGATADAAAITQMEPSAFLIGGNIYSPTAVTVFELVDSVPGDLADVALQLSTKGSELDYALVTLHYVDGFGVVQDVPWTTQTELFKQAAQGFDVETLFTWDLSSVGDAITDYTITWEAFEPSMSLDAVTLDTRFEGAPEVYCTALVNSAGCTPQISAGTGYASNVNPNPFLIQATQVLENKNGLLFYGLNGSRVFPFLGGTLCVQPPLRRTTIQFAGSDGSVCGGLFSMDFNAWIQSGVDPLLTAGQEVHAQYWSRDPMAGFGSGLTDGLRFNVLD